MAVRFLLWAEWLAGLLYQSTIGVDGVGSEDGNEYQLNDNGLLFVRYGLKKDTSGYVKSSAPLGSITTEDIDKMFVDAINNVQ